MANLEEALTRAELIAAQELIRNLKRQLETAAVEREVHAEARRGYAERVAELEIEMGHLRATGQLCTAEERAVLVAMATMRITATQPRKPYDCSSIQWGDPLPAVRAELARRAKGGAL